MLKYPGYKIENFASPLRDNYQGLIQSAEIGVKKCLVCHCIEDRTIGHISELQVAILIQLFRY